MQELYEKVGTALLRYLHDQKLHIGRPDDDCEFSPLSFEEATQHALAAAEVACKVIIEEAVKKRILRQDDCPSTHQTDEDE